MSEQNINTDFMTSVLAITAEKYIPKLQDNVYGYNAALKMISEKDSVSFTKSGESIICPVLIEGTSNGKAYGAYDNFDMSPQKGIVDASAKIRQYAEPITISDAEIRINSGKEQIVNIMSARLQIADMALKNRIQGHMYGDGTADGGNALLGLGAMVEEKVAASQGEYMNITSDAWVNQYATSSAGVLLATMDTLDVACGDGSDMTNLILADSKFYNLYQAAARSAAGGGGTMLTDPKMAELGFRNVMYKGVPVVLDKTISASVGKAYFLNTNYLGFLFDNIRTTEFVRSGNSLVRSAFLDTATQLITNNRRRQGVLVLS